LGVSSGRLNGPLVVKVGGQPVDKVRQIMDELKTLQKEKERLQGAAMKDASAELVENARVIAGTKVISARVDGLGARELRSLADKIRDRLASGVIVLASEDGGQAALLSMVTKDLTDRFKAGEILKQVAQACGGRGGGKPDMAQGGTKDTSNLDAALESVLEIVKGN
ncbi:hypothetical protein LCGC14_2718790, partial [marine sediment metagenome]